MKDKWYESWVFAWLISFLYGLAIILCLYGLGLFR